MKMHPLTQQVAELVTNAEDVMGRSLTHIKYDKGVDGASSIHCKLCGVQMSGLVETDKYQRVENINGQKVVYRHLIHARNSMYNEIDIEFDDGSHHVTHVCRECVKKGFSHYDLDFLHLADIAQWLFEYRTRHGIEHWLSNPSILERKAVSYTELGGLD